MPSWHDTAQTQTRVFTIPLIIQLDVELFFLKEAVHLCYKEGKHDLEPKRCWSGSSRCDVSNFGHLQSLVNAHIRVSVGSLLPNQTFLINLQMNGRVQDLVISELDSLLLPQTDLWRVGILQNGSTLGSSIILYNIMCFHLLPLHSVHLEFFHADSTVIADT